MLSSTSQTESTLSPAGSFTEEKLQVIKFYILINSVLETVKLCSSLIDSRQERVFWAGARLDSTLPLGSIRPPAELWRWAAGEHRGSKTPLWPRVMSWVLQCGSTEPIFTFWNHSSPRYRELGPENTKTYVELWLTHVSNDRVYSKIQFYRISWR